MLFHEAYRKCVVTCNVTPISTVAVTRTEKLRFVHAYNFNHEIRQKWSSATPLLTETASNASLLYLVRRQQLSLRIATP